MSEQLLGQAGDLAGLDFRLIPGRFWAAAVASGGLHEASCCVCAKLINDLSLSSCLSRVKP